MDKLLKNLGCVHGHVRSKLTPILTNRKLTANGIAISVSHMGTWIFSNFVLWILSGSFVWAHCVIIISATSGWNKQNMIIGRLKEEKGQWHPLCNVNYANESEVSVTHIFKNTWGTANWESGVWVCIQLEDFQEGVKTGFHFRQRYLLIWYSQFNKENSIFVHFFADLTANLETVCCRPIWFDLFPVEWTILNYNGWKTTTLKKWSALKPKKSSDAILKIAILGKNSGELVTKGLRYSTGDINQHESK